MYALRRRTALVILLVLLLPARGFAAQTQELDALRRQIAVLQQRLEAQQRQVTDQADAMRRQQDEIQRLTRELAALTTKLAALSQATESASPAAQAPPAQTPPPDRVRDAIGDLNSSAVAAGDFPGAIRIPGTDRVSIAIGGFVKTVAIGDSRLEGPGPIFLPAMIGTSAPDELGNVSIDATLSRLTPMLAPRLPMGAYAPTSKWISTRRTRVRRVSIATPTARGRRRTAP